MKSRRYFVLALLLAFCTSAFARQPLTYRPIFFTEKILQPDSVDALSILYYNAYAYKKAKYGLITGAVGMGLGAGLVWLKFRTDNTCDLGCAIAAIVVPLAGGVLGFTLGVLHASVKYRSEAGRRIHTTKKYLPFKKLGLAYNFNESSSYYSLLARRLPRAWYYPSTVKLYFFRMEKTYDYESKTDVNGYWSYAYVHGVVKGGGLQLLWIDYQRVLGWILGMDIGWGFGNKFDQTIAEKFSYRKASAINLHLIFGSNLNLFSSFSINANYRYRLYGIADVLKPAGYRNLFNRYSFSLGAVYYFR